MRFLGMLLLMLVVAIGVVFCAGPEEAPSFETIADFSFEISPAVHYELERVAEVVCPCGRCIYRGRVTADYARPNDARLANANYNHYDQMSARAIALDAESERLTIPRSISPSANRSRGTCTGRFTGAPA